MPDASTLALFVAAALALIVVPGPAVLYVVSQSIDRGRLAGFVSALGIAVGAVNGDLNSRRGRLHGMEPAAGMTTIKAEVPMAEMLTYLQTLTSITGGRGDYSMHFLRYEEVPAHVAQKVIEDTKREREAAATH